MSKAEPLHYSPALFFGKPPDSTLDVEPVWERIISFQNKLMQAGDMRSPGNLGNYSRMSSNITRIVETTIKAGSDVAFNFNYLPGINFLF